MTEERRQRAEAMLKGRAPVPLLLRAPLALGAAVNRAGMALRLARTPERVDARVISFGNLTLGGTGKTPAVIARAEQEIAQGRRVAVITRGYGAAAPVKEPFVCPPGDTSAAGGPLWKYCGDEAALIAQRVPGCAIVKGADRVAGARAAIAQLGCDTLLMDDGFQHVRLHRDENILLIDATCPFGNRRVFPAGYLREPLSAARRATEIVLTRCDQAGDLHGLEAELGALAPGVPIRKTWHAPEALVRLADGAVLPLEALRGMEIRALCGIGNPGAFHAALEQLGAVRRETVVLRDHGVDGSPETDPALPTIMTEKDAIKLSRLPGEAYALRIAFRAWGEG